ncbi:MAG: LamG domain-containing protein, partial [Candidatus Saccharimonadales bacterium]
MPLLALFIGGTTYAAMNLTTSSASNNQPIPPGINVDNSEKGLVGYWQLNGNAKDSTPYANNGTVNGATLTTDRKGQADSAYSFNGVNNSISIPSTNTLSPTNAITVSAWVNLNNVTTTNADTGVVLKGYYVYGFTRDTRSAENKVIHTYLNGGGNSLGVAVPAYNQWMLVTYTYDDSLPSNQWIIYINGVHAAQRNYTSPITNSGNTSIGDNAGGSQYFSGSIADVRIYNRAISAAEIKNLYNDYNSQI